MMNSKRYALMASFLLLTFLSAKAQVKSKAYDIMLKGMLSHSVEETAVTDKIPQDAVLLDAREKREFEVSHLTDAQWVGYDDFDLKRVAHLDKEQEIVVYCSIGYRSEKVAEQLEEAGFKQVTNLYGGIFEWVNQGKTVVNNNGTPTDSVHAYSKTWGIWLKNKEATKVYE